MVEIDVKRLAINRISAISILYTLLIFVQKIPEGSFPQDEINRIESS